MGTRFLFCSHTSWLGKSSVPHLGSGFQTEMFSSFSSRSSKRTFHLKDEGIEEPSFQTPPKYFRGNFLSVPVIYTNVLGPSRDSIAVLVSGLKKQQNIFMSNTEGSSLTTGSLPSMTIALHGDQEGPGPFSARTALLC